MKPLSHNEANTVDICDTKELAPLKLAAAFIVSQALFIIDLLGAGLEHSVITFAKSANNSESPVSLAISDRCCNAATKTRTSSGASSNGD